MKIVGARCNVPLPGPGCRDASNASPGLPGQGTWQAQIIDLLERSIERSYIRIR